MQTTYKVRAKIWEYPGKASWHFVSIPTKTAQKINFFFGDKKRGWGSLPVRVILGKSVWTTSIFLYKKSETFLLPIKASVRKENKVKAGDKVSFSIEVLVDV